MVCIQKRRNESILISHDELEMEYQRGVEALQLEQEKVRQEESKKPRRKIPKAGCYPSGFSTFTGKRVACTISLSERRRDLLLITSGSESIRSGYFNDAGNCSKQAWELGLDTGSKRHCRLNLTLQNFVHPYSAAEERRQLQKVLRQSVQEQPALPLRVSSKRSKRG
eukprot:CAMPEP_0172153668 /NCGR_PEP_ID=MMETSP1050-20130122/1585_1 /TAXON_ID=233186 /ORGANISM="Cryptomonas curvata, Strain CCAP979/52" /LENGTH=166 /DNA_ID=CAMNT_0012822255 /DNA_START=27 /DNA_END=527 /DNA_ORIENTATION=+